MFGFLKKSADPAPDTPVTAQPPAPSWGLMIRGARGAMEQAPLLLFCPAKSASALPALRATGRFAVNVLHRESEAVANRFATRNIDRFADAVWEDWDGLPILADALASFACTLHAEHDGGDHIIMVGRIERLRYEHARDPLLYLKGRYRQVHAPQ